MAHIDHGDGDQHDVQVNGDGDHHVTIGHTVLQLCECRSYRSTFTCDNVIFLACDVMSRTTPLEF
jgi:hypothetical protein